MSAKEPTALEQLKKYLAGEFPRNEHNAALFAELLQKEFGFTKATAEAYAREWEQEGEKK